MGPVELLMAGFDPYDRADQVMDELRTLDRDERLSILNAVVLKKDAQGKITVSGDGDVRPGEGALFGALVGALVGLLGGPGGAVVGAAAGAITGGITAKGIDLGFSDEMVEKLQENMRPDSSAILALVEQDWLEQVTEEITTRKGRIVHQALRADILERIRKDRDQ